MTTGMTVMKHMTNYICINISLMDCNKSKRIKLKETKSSS